VEALVNRIIFSLILMLASVISIAPANAVTTAPPPKVVFMGDWVTGNWNLSSINPNWIAVDGPGFNSCWTEPLPCWGGTSSALLADMPFALAQHPAIIHILMGVDDEDGSIAPPTGGQCCVYPYSTSQFLINLDSMVKQARAAHVQVILGIEPSVFGFGLVPLQQLNSIIANYGAENNIPVINYADALCRCVDSVGGASSGLNFNNAGPLTGPPGYKENDGPVPTLAGYAVMTQMAEAVINTLNLRLTGGYLQNQESSNTVPIANVNTVGMGNYIQFTPQGYYNNGLVEPFMNDNFAGASGTWNSSNPLVMYVSQNGLAWPLSPGTANITYISPTGVKFSEWTMHITGE
jgi:hypothetical protein